MAAIFALVMLCGVASAQNTTAIDTVVAVPPPDIGVQLVEWQKTVDEAEQRLNAGPIDPATITDAKERLKNLRALIADAAKRAEAELKTQNDLLTALGTAPEKDSGLKEDKALKKQRDEIAAQVSKLDGHMKQASLLMARVDKLSESIGKQKTDIRKTELQQNSGYLLTPETLKRVGYEGQQYFATVKISAAGRLFLVLSALLFWGLYRSLRRIKEWLSNRQFLKYKAGGSSVFLQMLVCALPLIADRFDIFGWVAAAPVFSDMLRLVLGGWLALSLFTFLMRVHFEELEEETSNDGGMPVGFLNFVLSAMRFVLLLALPAAVLGYVQMATFATLNIFGTITAVGLFAAARGGIIGLNARLAKLVGVEKLLSPLVIAFFEPVLAGLSLLFAASFWGLSPADVRDWLDKVSAGITIGSIKLDFSDAGAAAAVFFGLYVLTKAVQLFLAKRLFPQTHMDRGVQDAVYTLIGYIGISIALLTSLGTLGLDMAKLAIVAGALSVGIGFGLQAIVNNFVSGLILLFERPIRVGDYVKVGAEQGRVRRIRVRSTELETTQAGSIIVPNSKLIAENVTNWTLEGRSVRLEILVTVANACDTETVKKLLTAAATEHPHVRKRPEPQVLFTNFTATGKEFELRCFIRDIADRPQVSSDLRFAIDRLFRENEIVRA